MINGKNGLIIIQKKNVNDMENRVNEFYNEYISIDKNFKILLCKIDTCF